MQIKTISICCLPAVLLIWSGLQGSERKQQRFAGKKTLEFATGRKWAIPVHTLGKGEQPATTWRGCNISPPSSITAPLRSGGHGGFVSRHVSFQLVWCHCLDVKTADAGGPRRWRLRLARSWHRGAAGEVWGGSNDAGSVFREQHGSQVESRVFGEARRGNRPWRLSVCLSGRDAKDRETKKKTRKKGETLSRAKTAHQVGWSLFTLAACRRALTPRGEIMRLPLGLPGGRLRLRWEAKRSPGRKMRLSEPHLQVRRRHPTRPSLPPSRHMKWNDETYVH